MLDWRRPADYRFSQGFSDHRWAWEFLRRNPEYRKDWATAITRYLSKADPEDLMTQGDEESSFTGDPEHPNFFLPDEEGEQKWRLADLFNPATDAPYFLAFKHGFGDLFTVREGWPARIGGAQYPWAFFDLGLPLKPQLEVIARVLAEEQKRRGFKPRRIKHHRKMWPLYLRLLDADLAGRSPKQIADALDGETDTGGFDEKKVWDQLRAAKRMTQPEGYLSIFLSPRSD